MENGTECNQEYNRWLSQDNLDETLLKELREIEHDANAISDHFYKKLEFGTAGLRGIIGVGTNRMNIYVVRQATQGLADYLCELDNADQRGVAIAYDSRTNSELFAREAACVLAQNGIKVYLYSTLHSVPQLSFTVRYKKAIAGIVITASHNPSQYNGYKVYNEFGGQLDPIVSAAVMTKISATDMFSVYPMELDTALELGLVQFIGEEIDNVYYSSLKTLLMHPDLPVTIRKSQNIVYTPLHGAGAVPVQRILSLCGLGNVFLVPEQAEPDPNFPTVKAPNPEDKSAFTLAIALANEKNANLILATDPDSDRLGVGVRDKIGEFCLLAGNKIASVLIHYLLSSMSERGLLPKNGIVAKSIVSTHMANKICANYGVACEEVLTGFRFISEIIAECDQTHENEFLFGFEESYGFLAGTFARDKDAICAAMLIVEAYVYYKAQGKSLLDVLDDMYAQYGYFDEVTKSFTLSGIDGMKLISDTMNSLRENPPTSIGGKDILSVEDYKAGIVTKCDGTQERLKLPTSDVIRYLACDAWVCVRPSGTEPKLKVYVGANANSQAETKLILDRVFCDVTEKIQNLLG